MSQSKENRRSFLKTSAAAVSVPYFLSRQPVLADEIKNALAVLDAVHLRRLLFFGAFEEHPLEQL